MAEKDLEGSVKDLDLAGSGRPLCLSVWGKEGKVDVDDFLFWRGTEEKKG